MKYLPSIILLLLFVSCNNSTDSNTAKAAEEQAEVTQIQGIVDINPLNDPTPLSEMVTFNGIGPGAHLISPYTLKGKAIGSWYWEGSFPVTIVGEDGNLIASAPATAMGNWMQAGWVPYQSKLTWIAGPDTKAKLVLSLDNPAEGEGKIRALEIPVLLK